MVTVSAQLNKDLTILYGLKTIFPCDNILTRQ